MKILARKIAAIMAGMFFTTAFTVYGDILYENATTDTGNSLSFVNGLVLGDEITMSSSDPFDIVTDFSFEIYSPNETFTGNNVQMQVFLFANDGALTNGYPMPGTSIYDSGLFALSTPYQYAGGDAVTLDFDLSSTPVTVPNDFTLAVEVTGLQGSDSAGLELFDPPTYGTNYGDYWQNSGEGWALFTNGVPTAFGAEFQGTPTATPEPSTLNLGGMSAALLMGLAWLRRRQNQLKQD